MTPRGGPVAPARPVAAALPGGEAYDPGRRFACHGLLGGPVRRMASLRLGEMALAPGDHEVELAGIFAEVERIAPGPSAAELTGVAARALAAHARRRRRSLAGSIAAVGRELDRRFAACEAGQAAYPLRLAGLGLAGREGLEHGFSPFFVTQALERIVESALLASTVVEPASAPGAYPVCLEPGERTRAEVQALLARSLAAEQNATIDFALEEIDCRPDGGAVAFEQLQCVVLALRPAVDVQGLVAHAHALVSALDEHVDLGVELGAAAEILDGSGLATEGTLALGKAIGAVTRHAAGLVSSLHRTVAGADGGGDSAELARIVLHIALVVAWCAEHGRIRCGVITVDERVDL